MSVIATLRVVPQWPSAEAPLPERVLDAARRLRKLGVDVVNTGRHSVIIMADEGSFERILGISPPDADAGLALNISPREMSLRGIVDRVEVAPPAQFLDM